jgi:hypothetical protein
MNVLPFYVPHPKELLRDIWDRQRAMTPSDAIVDLGLPEDERVEDAGLEYDEPDEAIVPPANPAQSRKKVAA